MTHGAITQVQNKVTEAQATFLWESEAYAMGTLVSPQHPQCLCIKRQFFTMSMPWLGTVTKAQVKFLWVSGASVMNTLLLSQQIQCPWSDSSLSWDPLARVCSLLPNSTLVMCFSLCSGFLILKAHYCRKH